MTDTAWTIYDALDGYLCGARLVSPGGGAVEARALPLVLGHGTTAWFDPLGAGSVARVEVAGSATEADRAVLAWLIGPEAARTLVAGGDRLVVAPPPAGAARRRAAARLAEVDRLRWSYPLAVLDPACPLTGRFCLNDLWPLDAAVLIGDLGDAVPEERTAEELDAAGDILVAMIEDPLPLTRPIVVALEAVADRLGLRATLAVGPVEERRPLIESATLAEALAASRAPRTAASLLRATVDPALASTNLLLPDEDAVEVAVTADGALLVTVEARPGAPPAAPGVLFARVVRLVDGSVDVEVTLLYEDGVYVARLPMPADFDTTTHTIEVTQLRGMPSPLSDPAVDLQRQRAAREAARALAWERLARVVTEPPALAQALCTTAERHWAAAGGRPAADAGPPRPYLFEIVAITARRS